MGNPLMQASTSKMAAQSRCPSPMARAAPSSSWASAVVGSGTPTVRPISSASPRSFCIIAQSKRGSAGEVSTKPPRYWSMGDASTLLRSASTARARGMPAFSARSTDSEKAAS